MTVPPCVFGFILICDAPYYLIAAKLLLTMNAIVFAALAMVICKCANTKVHPVYLQSLLGDIGHFGFLELQKVGDHHPYFKYALQVAFVYSRTCCHSISLNYFWSLI